MAADGSLTRHGFPRGFRFVPTDLELIYLLSDRIHRGKVPPPFDRIFHNLRILDYHPEELYERYKEDAEDRYIYFFSRREFKKQGTGGAAPGDKDQKEPRLVRAARGGGWKATGGGTNLRWPRRKGGFFAGRRMTLVFYDRRVDKSNWGMHEFVVPVHEHENLTSSPPTHFNDLALYRLYILRSGGMDSENDAAGSSSQMLANGYGDHFSPSAAVPPVHPREIFDAGASTSQMPQQHRPSVEHAHYYYHHQFAFDAASAGAATQQQAHDMPVNGAGLPGDSCRFAIPAAHGAGQEAGNFVAMRSPCSPPAIGSPPTEQHATATTEPAHAQSADCVKPVEEAAPPPLEDYYDGPGMPDCNLDFAPFDEYSFQFTMEEILGGLEFDEPPAMAGDSNSGGVNYSGQAGDTKQGPPPSALSFY